MKKKLDTRFPAGWIKKIMQADEDVGGKLQWLCHFLFALELLLQELCNRTHEITMKKGSKIVNSRHLEIVRKVPLFGEPDTPGEDCAAPKRRKVIEDEKNDSNNESKKSRGRESIHSGSSMRGRVYGRGQGHGQGTGGSDGDRTEENGKFEDDADLCELYCEYPERADIRAHHSESKALTVKSEELADQNFDLNVSLDENGDSRPMVSGSAAV